MKSSSTSALKKTPESIAEEGLVSSASPRQKEKKGNYRLLHDGPKLFWRTHTTLEISIYLHPLADCIELVGFDVDKFKELNRTYFHYSTLANLTAAEAMKRLAAKQSEDEER